MRGHYLDFFRILLIALDQKGQKPGEARRMTNEEFEKAAPPLGGNYNPRTITRLSGDINRIFKENHIRKPIIKDGNTLILDEQIEIKRSKKRLAEQQRFETCRIYSHANRQVNNNRQVDSSSPTQIALGGLPVTADFGNGFTLDLSRNGTLLKNGRPVDVKVDRTSLAILKEVIKRGKRSVTMAELAEPLSALGITNHVRTIVSKLKTVIEVFRANGIAPPINLPNYTNIPNYKHGRERIVELTNTCEVESQRKRDEKRNRKEMEQPIPSGMMNSDSSESGWFENTMGRLASLDREQREAFIMNLMDHLHSLQKEEEEEEEAEFERFVPYLTAQSPREYQHVLNVLQQLEHDAPGTAKQLLDAVTKNDPAPNREMIRPRRQQ